jgi:membrane-associated HD superfamily phosphohydrolase
MYGLNRVIGAYTAHYNRLFWLFFVIAAAIFIYSIIFTTISFGYLDIAIGLILVVIGIHRIGEEFSIRRMKDTQNDTSRYVNELLQWAQKSYDYTRSFKEKHEKRLFNLDKRRIALEEQTDEQFRAAVKKVIELENRLSKLTRAIEQGLARAPPRPPEPAPQRDVARATAPSEPTLRAPEPKSPTSRPTKEAVMEARLSDLTPNQLNAIKLLRKQETLTNKEYRKAFKVSDKKAYNEIMFMLQRGLIKRRGKGRSTHYILGF